MKIFKMMCILFALGIAPSIALGNDAETVPPNDIKKAAFLFNYIGAPSYGDMYGLNIFSFNDGFGWYLSMKTNTFFSQLDTPYFDDKDVKDTVDTVTLRFKEADLLTLGTTWQFSSYVSVYLGVGYASNSGYAKLYGPVAASVGEPVLNQSYYVNDEANTTNEFYMDGGILLSYQSFMLQIGQNNLTDTYEIGLGFVVDL